MEGICRCKKVKNCDLWQLLKAKIHVDRRNTTGNY
jgi:hypothetical protein